MNLSGESQSVDVRGASDTTMAAYQQLREAILDGTLAPGRVISQVQLSAEMGVSRTPLREALRILQSEGLVDSDFYRRVRVAPLTAVDLENLYATRVVLEPFAVQLTVPDLDDRELDEAAAAMREAHQLAAAGDWRWTGAHRRFHLALFSGANAGVQQTLASLWDRSERYCLLLYQQQPALGEVVGAEHEAILAAARKRDGELCGRLTAEHLSRAALALAPQVDLSHEPKTLRAALAYATERRAG